MSRTCSVRRASRGGAGIWGALPCRAFRASARSVNRAPWGRFGPRKCLDLRSERHDHRLSEARGEDIADPDVRRVVADLVRRAVALLTAHHPDIAEDSPRLRYALECWTGLNRAATRRWLRGEATREATHELLTSTLEHVLRTFGARSAPSGRTAPA